MQDGIKTQVKMIIQTFSRKYEKPWSKSQRTYVNKRTNTDIKDKEIRLARKNLQWNFAK